MISEEIRKSFIALINQLDEILPVLNKQGTRLMEEQHYQKAGELISKAEKILSLQSQLRALQDEWLSLGVSTIESLLLSERDFQKDLQMLMEQFRAEPHLGYKTFMMPILQALVDLGGLAKREFVFDELEKLMFDQLTEKDWHTLPSDGKSIRWHKIASNARTHLLKKGLIKVDVKKGTWAITSEGRKALEQSEIGG